MDKIEKEELKKEIKIAVSTIGITAWLTIPTKPIKKQQINL